MLALLGRLMKEDEGQDLAEYGIALAVIAVGAGALAVAIAGDVKNLWNTAQTAIQGAA